MALSLVPDEPPFAPLATERLTLRPLRAADAEELHRLVNDWAVVRMLSRLPFPYPRQLTDEWIASTLQQIADGTGYHLAITGQEDGQEMIVGCIGLRLDLKPRTGNLGYWVGRRFWGHGVATEAAGRLSRWALANLDLDRLEAHVAEDNLASAAVLRRIGFRMTGTGRERFLARGGEHPVLRFQATRDDFAPRTPMRDQLSPTAPQRRAAPAPPERPERPWTGLQTEAVHAGRRLRADRRGRPHPAGAASGGQADGRAVGVPRRQAPSSTRRRRPG